MAGKIVAIIAPTRTGKSFLTEKLAEFYKAPAIFEVDWAKLPKEVEESARTGQSIHAWLYFRDRVVEMQAKAQELAQKHPLVFMDATWVSNRPYINTYQISEADRKKLLDISDSDIKNQTWPDIIIHLTCDDATSKRLWRSSGKSFEQDDSYFQDRLLPIKREFEAYFSTLAIRCPVLSLDRSALDFNKSEDLLSVAKGLDALLVN